MSLALALALAAPLAHAQAEGESLAFVYTPVQLTEQLDRSGLHALYIDPELVRVPEKSGASTVLRNLAAHAASSDGCVGLTRDAAQALAEEVACAGGSVTRSTNPLAGILEPHLPDAPSEDGCNGVPGCSQVPLTPPNHAWVEFLWDFTFDSAGGKIGDQGFGTDDVEKLGDAVASGEVMSEEQVIQFQQLKPIEDLPADDGDSTGGDDANLDSLVRAVLGMVEIIFGVTLDEEKADKASEQSEYPQPDDSGPVPVECTDAVADGLPVHDGDVDPSPIDDDGGIGGDVYMGCFPGADLTAYISDCTTDLYAYVDPQGGSSLCADGEMVISLNLLTRDDLWTDPTPIDDGDAPVGGLPEPSDPGL